MRSNLPSDIHSKENLDKLSRRAFVSTLFAAGFGIGTARSISASDVDEVRNDEIPIVIGYSANPTHSNDLKAHKKIVPSRWYNRLSIVRKEYNRILNGGEVIGQYHVTDDSVVGVWQSAGAVDGQAPYIELEVLDGETVPLGYMQSNGVPIRITKVEKRPPVKSGRERRSLEAEPVPSQTDRAAGQKVGNGNGSYGTLGAPVSEGLFEDDLFFTCEHIGSFSEGDKLYTSGSSYANVIGEVIDSSCSDDFAVAEPKNGYMPSSEVVGESGRNISGQYSKDGLAHIDSNDETVHKYGQKTGHTSGTVEKHDGTWVVDKFSCPVRRNQFRWGSENDGSDGDSGAPVYTENPVDSNSLWAAASFHARYNDYGIYGDFCFGTSSWALREDHGWIHGYTEPNYPW